MRKPTIGSFVKKCQMSSSSIPCSIHNHVPSQVSTSPIIHHSSHRGYNLNHPQPLPKPKHHLNHKQNHYHSPLPRLPPNNSLLLHPTPTPLPTLPQARPPSRLLHRPPTNHPPPRLSRSSRLGTLPRPRNLARMEISRQRHLPGRTYRHRRGFRAGVRGAGGGCGCGGVFGR